MMYGKPKGMSIYLVKKEMTCWEVVRSLVKVSMIVVVYLIASAEAGISPPKSIYHCEWGLFPQEIHVFQSLPEFSLGAKGDSCLPPVWLEPG